MPRPLKILVLVDPATIQSDDPEFRQASDSPVTEYHVIEALRILGHEPSVLGALDVSELVTALTEQPPDLVFNLTEEFRGDRVLDKNIAALLELLQIPYTGSGTMGLMLCRDKRLCKEMLSLHKIRVPRFVSLPQGKAIRVPRSISYPLVVKPAMEDGSEGISNASLVRNEEALQERTRFIHARWDQPVIAEEYVEGRELYVSILGNKRLTVLPIRECLFNFDSDEGPCLATYKVKWSDQYRERWNIRFGFAELPPNLVRQIQRTCKRVYRILKLRDYGRIDLRLTPDQRLVVLEANPNPDIAYGEEVAEAAEQAGIGYESLIARIVQLALRRYA